MTEHAAQDAPQKRERIPEVPLTPGDYFVDTKEAARILCSSEDTLVTWRNRKKGPPFRRPSTNKVVYLRSELIAWMEQYRVGEPVQAADAHSSSQPLRWE